MSRLTPLAAALLAAALAVPPAHADVDGDMYTIANTFEDSVFTGGEEFYFFNLPDDFGLSGEISDPGLEVDGLAMGLIYDFDINDGRFEMTLVDNSQASDLILPDGRFDRYYVAFDENVVTEAALDLTSTLSAAATVELVPAGAYSFLDGFDVNGNSDNTELLSFTLPNDGFLITLGPGTNLETNGVSLAVDFTVVPEPGAVALAGLGLGGCAFRRRR